MKYTQFVSLLRDIYNSIPLKDNVIPFTWYVFFKYPHLTPTTISDLTDLIPYEGLITQFQYLYAKSPKRNIDSTDKHTYQIFKDCDFIKDLEFRMEQEAQRRATLGYTPESQNFDTSQNNTTPSSDSKRGKKVKIEWSYVEFLDGKILIHNPFGGFGLAVSLSTSKKDFEKIKNLFALNCPELIVHRHSTKIFNVTNLDVINKFIVELKSSRSKIGVHRNSESKDKKNRLPDVGDKLKELQIAQVKTMLNNRLSQYFDRLCSLHTPKLPVYYCLEHKVGSNSHSEEKAFIFTVEITPTHRLLIYENTNPKRSTILFAVKTKRYKEALKDIHTFFASNMQNKRESLQNPRFYISNNIVHFDSIYHTDFYSWSSDITINMARAKIL